MVNKNIDIASSYTKRLTVRAENINTLMWTSAVSHSTYIGQLFTFLQFNIHEWIADCILNCPNKQTNVDDWLKICTHDRKNLNFKLFSRAMGEIIVCYDYSQIEIIILRL